MVKEIAGQYDEKVDEANEMHDELLGISAVALGKEINTDSYADVDIHKAGASTDDIEDIIALAKAEAD